MLTPDPPPEGLTPEEFEVAPYWEEPVTVWEPATDLQSTTGSRSAVWAFLGAVVGTGLTLGSLAFFGLFDRPSPVIIEQPAASQPARPLVVSAPEEASRVSAIASAARPSIVTVHIEVGGTRIGSGSGVIFRSDGYLLTNHHVVEGANSLLIELSNGLLYEADLVGSDPLTDIAVVKIGAEDLPAVEFSDVGSLAIGDLAVAVGNPLGLEGGPSVTSGIISAFNRTLEVTDESDQLFGLIQTDAPITLGSSGGALLDAEARLVGITTAIGVSEVGAEGLGFAVPINIVERVANDLIKIGEVRHAFLGIDGKDAVIFSEEGPGRPLGIEIVGFADGSVLAAGGSETGDIITSVDSRPVTSLGELVAFLRAYREGEPISVEVLRDNQVMIFVVELGRHPGSR